MTISTGAFDSFGIPQGSPNRLDDLADVDTLEAKEGNTIHQRGGRWVPADGNEVSVQSGQPTDLGVELWVNLDEEDPPPPLDVVSADTRYVNVDGDTMHGDLDVQADLHTNWIESNVGGWFNGHVYLGADCLTVYSNSTNSTQRYIGMRLASSGNPGLRVLQDTGNTLAPLGVGDPNVPEHATTKGYVDTKFVDQAGSRRILYAPSAISIANNTYLRMTGGWSVAAGDTGNTGLLTYSGGTITVASDCVLDIMVSGNYSGATTGKRYIAVFVNGSAVSTQTVFPTAATAASIAATAIGVWCGAGSTVQVEAFQDSGAALNFNAGRWNIRKVANG